jgi:hypothetical protein
MLQVITVSLLAGTLAAALTTLRTAYAAGSIRVLRD